VLTTFSKRKKKGKPRSSDEPSPLLAFPVHQENILTDEAFNLFDTNPVDSDDSKSQVNIYIKKPPHKTARKRKRGL
jgi:hypothetical protein